MPDTLMMLRRRSQGKGAEDFLQVHLKCECDSEVLQGCEMPWPCTEVAGEGVMPPGKRP